MRACMRAYVGVRRRECWPLAHDSHMLSLRSRVPTHARTQPRTGILSMAMIQLSLRSRSFARARAFSLSLMHVMNRIIK